MAAHRLFDLIRERSSTTGTGLITTTGVVPGFFTFSSELSSGQRCTIDIVAVNSSDQPTVPTQREICEAVYSSNTLTRGRVWKSSAGAGTHESFTGGRLIVSLVADSERLNRPRVFHVHDYGAVGNGTAAGTGTDDTAAFQEAIDEAGAANGGVVMGDNRIYLLSSASTTVEGSLAQLHLPTSFADTTHSGVTIEICGPFSPMWGAYAVGHSTALIQTSGMVLRSTVSDGGAVIGGACLAETYGNFTNVHAVFRNLTVRTYDNPNGHGLNMLKVAYMTIRDVVIDTGIVSIPDVTEPTHDVVGLYCPGISNGAYRIDGLTIAGYNTGIVLSEHADIDKLATTGCYYSAEVGDQPHAMRIGRWIDSHSRNTLRCTATNSPNNIPALTVEQLAVEFVPTSGAWATPAWQIWQKAVIDPNARLRGRMSYTVCEAGAGEVGGSHFVQDTNSQFVCTNLRPLGQA